MHSDRWRWLLPTSDRTQQAGMFLGSAAVPLTFQRTLMPRSTMDQAIVTGIVMALSHTIGSLVQEGVEEAAHLLSGTDASGDTVMDRRRRRHSLVLDLAAMGLGFAIQTAFRQHPGEGLRRATVRTGGYWLSAGAFAGFTVTALQEAADDLGLRRLLDHPGALSGSALLAALFSEHRRFKAAKTAGADGRAVRPSVAIAIATGVAAGISGLSNLEHIIARCLSRTLSHYLPAEERLWRLLGHIAVLFAIAYGITLLMHEVNNVIENGAERLEPAFTYPPSSHAISGGPGSLVLWETLSKQGRRITSTYLRPEWIADVMGEPALAQPIRIFVGVDSAPTFEERIDLALFELERTGAFDRSLLMVISPTGTGFANFVAVEAAEYMSRGDMASVTLQYGKRPSVLSLDLVPEARDLHRKFLEALQEKLAVRPPEKRPRVVLFGESLGAWASEAAFDGQGTDGLLALGIDRGLWIGTPHGCKWKDQVLGPPRPDVDKSLVGVFNDFGQVEAMDPEARARLRYVMITHYNDGVALFGLALLVQKPGWLGDPERRPPTIPASERYSTPNTFIQTLIDTKNAGFEVPGHFEANAHDYRADLAPFIREVYAFEVTEDQMARIGDALRRYEKARATWLEEQANRKNKNRKKEDKAK